MRSKTMYYWQEIFLLTLTSDSEAILQWYHFIVNVMWLGFVVVLISFFHMHGAVVVLVCSRGWKNFGRRWTLFMDIICVSSLSRTAPYEITLVRLTVRHWISQDWIISFFWYYTWWLLTMISSGWRSQIFEGKKKLVDHQFSLKLHAMIASNSV